MLVIFSITLVGGFVGGVTLFLMTNKKFNAFKFGKSVLLSIIAALMVPLFLNTISSNVVDNILAAKNLKYTSDIFLYLGFTLIASLSPRLFIDKLTGELIKRMEEKQEDTDAKIVNIEKVTKSLIKNTDKRIENVEPVYSPSIRMNLLDFKTADLNLSDLNLSDFKTVDLRTEDLKTADLRTSGLKKSDLKKESNLSEGCLAYLFVIFNNKRLFTSDVDHTTANLKKELISGNYIELFEIADDKYYSLTAKGISAVIRYVDTNEWTVEQFKLKNKLYGKEDDVYEVDIINNSIKHKISYYTRNPLTFEAGDKILITTGDGLNVSEEGITVQK